MNVLLDINDMIIARDPAGYPNAPVRVYLPAQACQTHGLRPLYAFQRQLLED